MSSSYEAVKGAIIQRVIYRHADLVGMHGLDKVIAAIENVAAGYDGVQLEEIGTSDVSCWVKDVERSLAPVPYVCKLCGQRITDGLPCGCGARPAKVWYQE